LLYWLLGFHYKTACLSKRGHDIAFAELLEQVAEAAFIKDQRGRYIVCNSAMARLAGSTLMDCLHCDDATLFPAEAAQQFSQADQDVMTHGILLVREDALLLRGQIYVLASTRWPYRDTQGNIIGVVGLIQDISKQKAAEQRVQYTETSLETRVQERTSQLHTINQALERQLATRIQIEIALRDTEERFRQLTEYIQEVFWVYGLHEERILYMSPAYEQVWGRSIEALYERPLDWIEAIDPDDRSRVTTAMYQAQQTSGNFEEQYRIIRPDGAIRWIWARGFPIRDDTAHIYRIAGLAEDITTRKLAEDQLRRQQIELTRMSRLSLAVELASNLSHELNQPLAAIVAYTQACLTLLRQDNTDPRLLTGTLNEIANQGLRAGEIIRHLRELVHKHSAAQALLDLNGLIHSISHYAQAELRQANVSLQLQLAESLPEVLADDIQVQLVVLYLIRNAIDAINEKQTGPRQLIVTTARLDHAQVLTTVQDSGQGFTLEIAEQLFQPFFTTKLGGMGLGLSVSRSIIESQGGQLWATLNPEGGACFCFTLPIHLEG
jgi:two-component system sensor kinase FixL